MFKKRNQVKVRLLYYDPNVRHAKQYIDMPTEKLKRFKADCKRMEKKIEAKMITEYDLLMMQKLLGLIIKDLDNLTKGLFV